MLISLLLFELFTYVEIIVLDMSCGYAGKTIIKLLWINNLLVLLLSSMIPLP